MVAGCRGQHPVGVQVIEGVIRSRGFFLRRRDLLALGYSDGAIRGALRAKRIFRVRQGWYSIPSAPPSAVLAVRVGGRLTSFSALQSFGLRVPRQPYLHVAVKRTDCRLRRAIDRRARLLSGDPVVVHWTDTAVSGTSWRVSIGDALLAVLATESRDTAIACCSAALRHKRITSHALAAVFARAPERVRGWAKLCSALDESHGETFVRLWFMDAGVRCEQQAHIPGVGYLDFRVGPNSYVEVDGGQHDPEWTGDSPSSWERDHDRDTTVGILGGRTQRYTYRQLYTDWPRVLAAVERMVADDLALAALRRRRPYRPVKRKRRRIPSKSGP